MCAAVPPDEEVGVRTLLAYLGTAMVATGQPVGEVEDELTEVSVLLGYPDVQIAAAPTGVTLSLASGHPSTFEAVSGPLRLDQAAEVRASAIGCCRVRWEWSRPPSCCSHCALSRRAIQRGPPTWGWSGSPRASP